MKHVWWNILKYRCTGFQHSSESWFMWGNHSGSGVWLSHQEQTLSSWDLYLVSLYWVLSLFGFGYHWDCQLNVSDWMHWADTCLLLCWWKDPSVSDPRFSVSASINRASAKLDEEWHRPCLKVPLSLKVMKTKEVVQVWLLEVRKIMPSCKVNGKQCNYLN